MENLERYEVLASMFEIETRACPRLDVGVRRRKRSAYLGTGSCIENGLIGIDKKRVAKMSIAVRLC